MKTQLKPSVSNIDHIQGNENALLELVEYGDYQCPYCGKAYPIIKNIQRKMGSDLKFVFRNFPITEIHPQAFIAATAAEAAEMQEKFWEMHDLIYENQKKLTTENLFTLANTLGLNMEHFKRDIQTQTIIERIEDDFESGVRSGVNGTPSFFINGIKYNGNWEEDEFSKYLKNQLSFT